MAETPTAPTRLLATKLHRPASRTAPIARTRLDEELERGILGPLTLVCAAAGFGKTTLVADWLHRSQRQAGWYSLDAQDADPKRFARYLLAAITSVSQFETAGLGAELDGQAVDLQLWAIELVNALAEYGESLIVVLDDLHLVESAEIYELLSFVIEAAPANFHLIVTSRVEPPLQLSRLRARDQLTEVRGPQLRFTRNESRAFFHQTMDIELSGAALDKLDRRTEGWAVGLQLAALSLRGRADIEAFIDGFAGSHRYVLDYLIEEVLAGMAESTRNFLLDSSILDHFNAELLDAMNGRGDGRELIEILESENIFLVALDERRENFRYHHLFATLLRHELESSRGADELRRLHGQASIAYEKQDDHERTYHHAMAAHDWDRAEAAYLRRCDLMHLEGRERELLTLLEAFPAEELAVRPALLVKRMWTLTREDVQTQVARALTQARAALEGRDLPAVAAELSLFEILHAMHNGRVHGASDGLEAVLQELPRSQLYLRNLALMHAAKCHINEDRIERGFEMLIETKRIGHSLGAPFFAIWSHWWEAHVALTVGRVGYAESILDRLAKEVQQHYGDNPPRTTASGWGTMALVYYERGELEQAASWMERALELSDPRSEPGNTCDIVALHARIEAVRDPGGPGLESARHHARAILRTHELPTFDARLAATEVRLALNPRTHLDADEFVTSWLARPDIRQRVGPLFEGSCDPAFRRGFPDMIIARALTHIGQFSQAEGLLTARLAEAEAARRMLCQVELQLSLAMLAAAREGLGASCDAYLDAAIARALDEGFVGPFVELGDELLARAQHRALTLGAEDFAGRLAGLPGSPKLPSGAVAGAVREVAEDVRPATITDKSSPEGLSERELEVLALVAEGCSNAEVGRRLFVAPSTVKKHLQHVYDKLGVRRRTQAVARVQALGLL